MPRKRLRSGAVEKALSSPLATAGSKNTRASLAGWTRPCSGVDRACHGGLRGQEALRSCFWLRGVLGI